jgi:hypothetical protein
MEDLLDLIFGLFFIVWWFVCLKLLSKFSGWERLASKYALEGKFDGVVVRCQGRGGSTHIGVNDYGVYLAVLFCFRPFHRPLFVPWQEIKVVRKKLLWTKGYNLVLPCDTQMEVFFSKKTFKRLAEHAHGNLKASKTQPVA